MIISIICCCPYCTFDYCRCQPSSELAVCDDANVLAFKFTPSVLNMEGLSLFSTKNDRVIPGVS